MEEEDEKLRKMQDELESAQEVGGSKEEVDARSIYVGSVSNCDNKFQVHIFCFYKYF